MVDGPVFKVDPTGEFSRALKEAGKKSADLTIPLKLIAQSWFKSNRAIFALKGPGQYEDLTDNPAGKGYKSMKEKLFGSAYPILYRYGHLMSSITNPQDPASVNYIVNKLSLALGTKVTTASGSPYAYFLHHGASKMKARPVVLFGTEQVAPQELNKRVELWRQIMLNYVANVAKKNGTVPSA